MTSSKIKHLALQLHIHIFSYVFSAIKNEFKFAFCLEYPQE